MTKESTIHPLLKKIRTYKGKKFTTQCTWQVGIAFGHVIQCEYCKNEYRSQKNQTFKDLNIDSIKHEKNCDYLLSLSPT